MLIYTVSLSDVANSLQTVILCAVTVNHRIAPHPHHPFLRQQVVHHVLPDLPSLSLKPGPLICPRPLTNVFQHARMPPNCIATSPTGSTATMDATQTGVVIPTTPLTLYDPHLTL